MAIPSFVDGYHLPPGEHICEMNEIENQFTASSEQRQRVWNGFKRCLDRIQELGLVPVSVLIDGSFVTGREIPGDVDSVALIPEDVVREALKNADEHDRNAIICFASAAGNPNAQQIIRDLFGAHVFIVPDEANLQAWSGFFRYGGAQGLRDPDPARDPSWVTRPREKGILRINL